MEAIGSGCVIIIDGHDVSFSNIADIPDGNPFSLENLKVHICEKGNGYLINERKFIPEVEYLEAPASSHKISEASASDKTH
jgi:cyanophycinase